MTGGTSEAATASRANLRSGGSGWTPTTTHMLMLAAIVALGAAILAVPYLGLAYLAMAFVLLCVVMLLVILGWADKGAGNQAPSVGVPSGQDADANRAAR